MFRRTALVLASGLLSGCPAAADPDPAAEGGSSTTAEQQDGGDDVQTSSSSGDSAGSGADGDSTSATTTDSTTGCATDCDSIGDGESTADLPDAELDCHDGIDEDDDDRLDCVDSDCWEDRECAARFLRVATWNVRDVGEVGTLQHDQLIAVIQRIDADVLCLQEVGDAEQSALQAVATVTGYDHVVLAPAEGTPTGFIRNACLSRIEPAAADILYADDLSSDVSANDLTRPFVRLRLLVEPADRYVTVLAAHLKSGQEDVDRFRRMVEAIRLGQAVEAERDLFPNNAIVAFGDLNETPNPDEQTFTELPDDLPLSYVLGDDIDLPLSYEPFAPLEDAALERVHARVEDTPWTSTYLPGLVRLDYIYEDAGDLAVAEVYEACEDDGEDDFPYGDVLPKVGEPLPCGVSADASDHRPVVAVFYLAD